MLCSDCSQPVRPIVCLDIDGTLGDYHSHFTDFCVGYFGRPFLLGWDMSCEWNEWLGLSKVEYREAKLAFRQGGMKRTMPAFDYASQLSAVLSEKAEVWITTTRPYNRLDSVDPDTREWLSRNNIHYDHLLYDEDKYGRLSEIVDPKRVCAILDDLPEQYDLAASWYTPEIPILKEGDHNRWATRSRASAPTLDVAASIMMKKVEEWHQTIQD